MNNNLFDPHYEEINTVFGNSFTIPVFQRPYSWEKNEIDELFEDISRYFNNKKDEDMYIGTIYLSHKDNINSNTFTYEIIDGQQRITTLSLMLLVLYYYAKRYKLENERDIIILEGLLWKPITDRKPTKKYPLLKSVGLEETVMQYLFDSTFDYKFDEANNNKFLDDIKNYKCDNSLDERIIHNYGIINENVRKVVFKSSKEFDKEKFLDYINFILNNIRFITITVQKDNIQKLFEIFESINSKGKQLDQIDLIKSYIFQNIQGDQYDTYLKQWGNLIKKSNDNLGDYFYTFIQSYFKFYEKGLSAKYFKSLVNERIVPFYKQNNISDTLMKLIDDMTNKVDNYNYMISKNRCDWFHQVLVC